MAVKINRKVDRSRIGYARRKKRGGNGVFAMLVLLGSVAAGGYLLLQTRLGGGIGFARREGTPTQGVAPTPTRSFDDFVKQAEAAEARGAYRSAIELFDQASRRRPNEPDLHRRVARLMVFLNQPEKAEARARKALELKADHAPSRAVLCMAVEWQKRFDEAIAECRAALELEPKLVEAHAYLAEALADKEDFSGALSSGQQALDLDAKNTDALRNMGYLYYVFGRYDTALEYFRRALDVNPNLPVVLVGMAKIHITWAAAGAETAVINGNADTAAQLLEQAIALDDQNAEAYERLGEAYRIRGEFEKSGLAFDKALKLEPERISAYTRRGVLRFQRYAFLGAIDDYTRAISLTRSISKTITPTDYTFLGYAQQLAGRCDAARLTMSDALQLSPDNEYLAASAREIEGRCAGK